jgi:hypothetical protein
MKTLCLLDLILVLSRGVDIPATPQCGLCSGSPNTCQAGRGNVEAGLLLSAELVS